jgi:HD-like signal output (HDOD) protein
MSLGRNHRTPMRFPIHFTAPDRRKTYIGETIDISSTGFSVQVTTTDSLPTIILSGILPTEVASDSILCKARIVWQGGLAGGMKRASYKITSIARKSQDRLDQIIQDSIDATIEDLKELVIFKDTPRDQLETLLHLTRMREVQENNILFDAEDTHNQGLFIILNGQAYDSSLQAKGAEFGPGSVLGQWFSEASAGTQPIACHARLDTKILHITQPLIPEIEQRLPSLASILKDAIGLPAPPQSNSSSEARHRKLRQNILEDIQEIPTLPAVFNAVMDCVEDPEATPRDLALIIRKDQSLSVKVLRTANSALYGFSRRITSVDEAIVLLGMNQTANLAITAMLLNTMVDANKPGRKPEEFWIHSLGTAYIAQALGDCLKKKSSGQDRVAVTSSSSRIAGGEAQAGEAVVLRTRESGTTTTETTPRRISVQLNKLFTYSIVHDIGLVALFIKFPEHYLTVYDSIPEYGNFHSAELDLLEIDHCQFGYRIAQAWHLPEPIPTIIAEHHLPQLWLQDLDASEQLDNLLREDPLVTLISLAELITRRGEIGVKLDQEPPEIPDAMLEALGLDESDLQKVTEQLDTIREKSEIFFKGMTA